MSVSGQTAQSYFKKYRIIRPDEWKSFMDRNAYQDPTVRSATFDLTQTFSKKNVTMGSHFLMDAHLMHFKPYENLVLNPLSKNSWKSLLEQEMADPKYQELNAKVSRNPMLSLMATKNFLQAIVEKAQQSQNAIPPNMMPQNQPGGGGQQPFNFSNFMNALTNMQNGPMGNQATSNNILAGMASAASNATQQTNDMITVMNGFTHSGIPMKRLTDPDEMREILSNRFVVSLAKVMKRLNTDDSGKSHVKPSTRRGIPIGTKKMQYFSEIPDMVPQDMLDEDLQNYKIASKTAHVRERYSSMNNYLIYLDKSGSMGGGIEFIDDYAPKIAVAAASALGLARTVKAHGGTVTLKLFDTEVGDPITDMWDLLKTLGGIQADGGTNITLVLEDVIQKGRDYKAVLISDGIDSIDETVAKSCSKMDLTSVLIQTSNDLLEKYTNTVKITKFTGDNILMEL